MLIQPPLLWQDAHSAPSKKTPSSVASAKRPGEKWQAQLPKPFDDPR